MPSKCSSTQFSACSRCLPAYTISPLKRRRSPLNAHALMTHPISSALPDLLDRQSSQTQYSTRVVLFSISWCRVVLFNVTNITNSMPISCVCFSDELAFTFCVAQAMDALAFWSLLLNGFLVRRTSTYRRCHPAVLVLEGYFS